METRPRNGKNSLQTPPAAGAGGPGPLAASCFPRRSSYGTYWGRRFLRIHQTPKNAYVGGNSGADHLADLRAPVNWTRPPLTPSSSSRPGRGPGPRIFPQAECAGGRRGPRAEGSDRSPARCATRATKLFATASTSSEGRRAAGKQRQDGNPRHAAQKRSRAPPAPLGTSGAAVSGRRKLAASDFRCASSKDAQAGFGSPPQQQLAPKPALRVGRHPPSKGPHRSSARTASRGGGCAMPNSPLARTRVARSGGRFLALARPRRNVQSGSRREPGLEQRVDAGGYTLDQVWVRTPISKAAAAAFMRVGQRWNSAPPLTANSAWWFNRRRGLRRFGATGPQRGPVYRFLQGPEGRTGKLDQKMWRAGSAGLRIATQGRQ